MLLEKIIHLNELLKKIKNEWDIIVRNNPNNHLNSSFLINNLSLAVLRTIFNNVGFNEILFNKKV
jgi:hypothetical protein